MGIDVSELQLQAWHGGETLVGTDQLQRVCNAVCKIRQGRWVGTGFVIGDGLIMTNNHLVGDVTEAAQATAIFKINGTVVRVALDPTRLFITSPHLEGEVDKAHLDYTVVGCQRHPSLAAVFANPIQIGLWSGKRPDNAYVIGHPAGAPKMLTLRCTDMLEWKPLALAYTSECIGGSSGSPVLAVQDQQLKLFGLHHAGGPLTGNAINMKAIVCDLLARNQWRDLTGWVPSDRWTLYRAHFFMKKHHYGERVVSEALEASARGGHAGAEYHWAMVKLGSDGDKVEGIEFLRRSAAQGRYAAVAKATLMSEFSADEVASFWAATGREGVDVNSSWNRKVKKCGDAVRAASCGYLWHLFNAGKTLLSRGFETDGYEYLRRSASQGYVPAIQLAMRHRGEFKDVEITRFWKASDREPDNGDSPLGKLARVAHVLLT